MAGVDNKRPRTLLNESQQSSSRIELDVGGSRYATTIATLSSCPGMLSAMFSPRHSVVVESDGSVFIDRNGPLFAHVLEFLRNGSRWTPPTSVDHSALLNEAEYFGLQPMIEKLNPPPAISIQFQNTQRVGSVLALVDPEKEGEALFRPANQDSFSFGMQLLVDEQLVFITLIDTSSAQERSWTFLTDRGSLRSNDNGEAYLAFGPRPHARITDDDKNPWIVKAGDTIRLHYLRGPPSRLYYTHNDVSSDEQIYLNGDGPPVSLVGEDSLPPDGDFVKPPTPL